MEHNEKAAKPTHLAMEVLKHEQKKSMAKDVGIIGLTVAVIVISIGMAIINYRNDMAWRELGIRRR